MPLILLLNRWVFYCELTIWLARDMSVYVRATTTRLFMAVMMQQLLLPRYKKVTKESIANKYSVVIELKYDTSDVTEKHMFYEHFVAWFRDGCLIAPLTYYANNFIRTSYWKQIFFFPCQKNISWFERQHW